VQVADSANVTVSAPESMKTAPALTVGYLPACAGGNCVSEVGCVGLGCRGEFGYVTGGSPPYSFSVTAGTLPPGPALTGLALVGPFNGTGGTFNFEVTVTDGLGGKATLTPTFFVAARLFMNGGTCTGDYNTGCSLRLPYTGGIGTPSVAASVYTCYYGCPNNADPMPPGFSVVVAGGAVTVTFPKGLVNGWKGILIVQIADAYTSTAMFLTQVNVTVLPQPR
jgi:hypothetical protein